MHSYLWYWMEVSGRLHALATVPQEKEPPGPIELEGGWAPGLVWM
jgi:hypothetical protein